LLQSLGNTHTRSTSFRLSAIRKVSPNNKKVSIGKLDQETGQLIPNENYHEYYPVEFTHPSLLHYQPEEGKTLDVGKPFLTDWIFSSLGVTKILDLALGSFYGGQNGDSRFLHSLRGKSDELPWRLP
jgi:hypothetical protein